MDDNTHEDKSTSKVLHWYDHIFGGIVNWPIRFVYIVFTFCLEFPITAIGLIVNQEMKFTPEELARYYLITYTPWLLKPVYGLLSDQFPIFGYRRKPYIVIASVFSSAIFVGMSLVRHKDAFVALAVAGSLFNCVGEVALDSFVTELGNKLKFQANIRDKYPKTNEVEPNSALLTDPEFLLSQEYKASLPKRVTFDNARAVIQSECMTIRSTASVLAALLSLGVMALTEKARFVVFLTCIIPVFGVLSSFYLNEERLKATSHLHYACCLALVKEYKEHEAQQQALYTADQIESNEHGLINAPLLSQASYNLSQTDDVEQSSFLSLFFKAVWQRLVLLWRAFIVLFRPCLFVFIVNTMPKYSTPWYSYMYSLDFEYTWIYSAFTFISLVGSLIGSFLYLKIFANRKLDKVFAFVNVLDIIATIPMVLAAMEVHRQWGISDTLYICIVSFIDAIFNRIALMPSLVLAAESCPPQLGLEGTMFSMFSSITYLGSLSSTAIQVAMIRYLNLDGSDYSSLPDFMIVCLAFQLVPILFLQLVSNYSDHSQVQGLENENKTSETY